MIARALGALIGVMAGGAFACWLLAELVERAGEAFDDYLDRKALREARELVEAAETERIEAGKGSP